MAGGKGWFLNVLVFKKIIILMGSYVFMYLCTYLCVLLTVVNRHEPQGMWRYINLINNNNILVLLGCCDCY